LGVVFKKPAKKKLFFAKLLLCAVFFTRQTSLFLLCLWFFGLLRINKQGPEVFVTQRFENQTLAAKQLFLLLKHCSKVARRGGG
jgi:hypothetical protein